MGRTAEDEIADPVPIGGTLLYNAFGQVFPGEKMVRHAEGGWGCVDRVAKDPAESD